MYNDKRLRDKNILMIIASRNFRDEEYFIPFEVFQKEGAEITTASSVKGSIVGVEGGEARSSIILKDVETKNFNAIVFVGGNGAGEYFDNNEAHRIAQEASNHDKVLAAICIAPVILAKAGVLRGKTATVWSSLSDKKEIAELESAGCAYSDKKRVVRSGKLITADGPAVSKEFANAIVEAIIEKENKKDD